jgi:hypothetical protein
VNAASVAEAEARAAKVRKLAAALDVLHIMAAELPHPVLAAAKIVDALPHWTPGQRGLLASLAGVPEPSELTWDDLVDVYTQRALAWERAGK